MLGPVTLPSMPRHCHRSQGLKSRIPILFYEQDFTVKEICKILGIQKSLAYSSLTYFRTHGTTHNPRTHHKTGRRWLLLEKQTCQRHRFGEFRPQGRWHPKQVWNIPKTERHDYFCSLFPHSSMYMWSVLGTRKHPFLDSGSGVRVYKGTCVPVVNPQFFHLELRWVV